MVKLDQGLPTKLYTFQWVCAQVQGLSAVEMYLSAMVYPPPFQLVNATSRS